MLQQGLTTSESKQNQSVEEKEFENIENHATQRNLKWPQVGIDCGHMNQLQSTRKRKYLLSTALKSYNKCDHLQT